MAMAIGSFYNIKKEKLGSFLKAAMADFYLVGPKASRSGDFLLERVNDPGEMALNYNITSNSLKEFFFPRKETIFRYELRPGAKAGIKPEAHKDSRSGIFFGVRSCDVRAVYFQDLFFGREPEDALYRKKREGSVIISFGCNKRPHNSCFCVHTKSGPFLSPGEGFDLQLIDMPEDYLVECGSQKGLDLIEKYGKFFTPAGEDASRKKKDMLNACLKGFDQKYDVMGVKNKLKGSNLQELWKALGKRCTNCGGCEFICPTCFCFYQQDIKISKNRGERIRSWDSCTFAGYSRMAGNTAPHEENSDRISRRFFCKLYNCHSWFGLFGCTGCGRCSFVCPVNLDMESFISSLSAGDTYKPLLKEL